MNSFILEIIGWMGSILYVLSYFLLSRQLIKKGKTYYLLNGLAALCVVIISIYKNTYQPVAINIIWFYISYLGYNSKSIKHTIVNASFMNIVTILFIIVSLYSYYCCESFTYDILAWLSVFAFSSSYFLYVTDQITDKTFHFYNIIAALSILPKMIIFENYQVLLLEFFWVLLATSAYIRHSKIRH